jgi:hypothetical protein
MPTAPAVVGTVLETLIFVAVTSSTDGAGWKSDTATA